MQSREHVDCNDLPPGSMKSCTIEGREVVLCRTSDGIHALEGICPHRGAALAQGTLDGNVLTCPWHKWQFDVVSGVGITNPMSKLARYGVRENSGKVEVTIEKRPQKLD